MAVWTPIVLAALFAQTSPPTLGTVQARFASGAEWDTNARRAVEAGDAGVGGINALGVAGDGLVRITSKLTGQLRPTANLAAVVEYQLGAKRFFRERSEDYFAHRALGQLAWFVTDSITLGGAGTFRLSRLNNELRDYNIGKADAFARWDATDDLSFGVLGSYTGYRFLFDDHFNFTGPSIGADVTYRLSATLRLSAGVDQYWRDFVRNGLVEGVDDNTGVVAPTRCEAPDPAITCTPTIPGERELDVHADAEYVGPFRAGLYYRARFRRSTSPYENIDRHRVGLNATFEIVERLTATILGTLQIADGTSERDNLQQAEDDENRNSVTAGIRYALTDELSADLRYSFYVDLFSTNDATYQRQLVYVGLGYRTALIPLD